MDALLDTSVLVDLWRRHPAALSWAVTQRELVVGIHVVVGMELVEGVRDNQELAYLDRLLASAVRLDVPLYTLNLKHFQPLPEVKAIRPY